MHQNEIEARLTIYIMKDRVLQQYCFGSPLIIRHAERLILRLYINGQRRDRRTNDAG